METQQAIAIAHGVGAFAGWFLLLVGALLGDVARRHHSAPRAEPVRVRALPLMRPGDSERP